MPGDRKITDDIKSDREAILKEAERVMDPAKRRLFGNLLTLGGLSLATGIAVKNNGSIDNILKAVSRFNDGAQGVIFSENNLAPTYQRWEVANPFPFNAFYHLKDVPQVDGAAYKLQLSGQIADKRPRTLPQL